MAALCALTAVTGATGGTSGTATATSGVLSTGSTQSASGAQSAGGALEFTRDQGADRYETAVAISRRFFDDGAPAVVIASGEGFADALAGGPAAAQLGAPLLLTSPAALPTAVRAELQRLGPSEAVVLGGPAAVSDGVVTELRALGVTVTRASGTDRYDTAARTGIGLVAPTGDVELGEVVIASGEGFADGLSGGAYGAANAAPLLLTARDALPRETAAALTVMEPQSITIVGGPAAVSPAVEAALEAYTPGAVVRVQGRDRYETAARVAQLFPRPVRAGSPLLAAGTSFPDALAGAALGEPLLLTEHGCLPSASRSAVEAFEVTSVTVLGGIAVISDAAASGTPCA